ncbi:reticulon-1 isoform X1 [Anopheles ziemanni]|uniref:reticulon-1 isoform X1 n=1 Tax=Anopheles coustani TaxID=139045 RepID=UPI002658B4E4|nr:reticulon-1 isoform X1 [Anopheles coustani]XP_058166869.1 reticulon-1 isoform X1 [Anopheles ziemanni]
MQSVNMEGFQDKSENSLVDLSFENIGATLGADAALDNKIEMEKKLEDSLFSGAAESDYKAKDSDVFDECIPLVQSTYSEDQLNGKDEPFSVVEQFNTSQPVKSLNNAVLDDEVESDYMNPYVSIRQEKEKSYVHEESAATTFTREPVQAAPEAEENSTASACNLSNVVESVSVPSMPDAAKECIEIEQIFKDYGLDTWFNPARLHPKVESLIYWRDVKKSGVVFGGGLALLLAMSLFSLISVFSYLSLLLLFGTISFRIYKNVLQAVQKTAEGHPFKEYLDMDLTLSQEKVQQLATVAVAHVNSVLTGLRRLFLVEDLVDSIKFGVLLYWLTYVGAIFNGITCVMIGYVALFTLPKVYENNKQSVDTHIELVRSKLQEITEKVKAAVPLGKKTETEKTK